MSSPHPTNEQIADILARVGALLELRQANRHRVQRYHEAATTLRNSDVPIAEAVARDGTDALVTQHGIGTRLASAIEEIVETGRLRLLDRLEAEASPEIPFVRLAGLDEQTAARIHDALGVETLEDLEMAAHDGRLDEAEGLDRQQVEAIRSGLARMLSHRSRRPHKSGAPAHPAEAPPLELLLEIDEEYRRKAEAGELHTTAPRRFNPEREAWLPVMKVRRGGWSFVALFSNTARAHQRGKTRDWVVIYFKQRGPEDQCTVITASGGPLRGRRVAAGREDECRDYYAEAD